MICISFKNAYSYKTTHAKGALYKNCLRTSMGVYSITPFLQCTKYMNKHFIFSVIFLSICTIGTSLASDMSSPSRGNHTSANFITPQTFMDTLSDQLFDAYYNRNSNCINQLLLRHPQLMHHFNQQYQSTFYSTLYSLSNATQRGV